MNQAVRSLEPKSLWNYFADLNAVPRASKKEAEVIAFIKAFGASLSLEVKQDAIGNVVIVKPASPGMENRKTIVMQSHLDMVHQKNNDTEFDFATQGIEMFIQEDWVKAKGTTLGADNGIGVATIMAILASDKIEHPKIEALFTIDEETGMTGAMNLSSDLLTGSILLNLDTEEDDEIGIGCAGGVDVTAERSYKEATTDATKIGYQISVKGLEGGHSGIEIHKGLGNANKIMNRMLLDAYENFGLQISSIVGGSLRNAIPRESEAIVAIDAISEDVFLLEINLLITAIKAEQQQMDPNLVIELNKVELPEKVMDLGVQEGVIRSLHTAHNGVFRMSPEVDGLVEASNNIAKVQLGNGVVKIDCLTRSSVLSSRTDVANSLRAAFELSGCEVNFGGAYPGWKPNKNSPILKVLDDTYLALNSERAHIMACHAGLECGIIGEHYPQMDMVSFGPTILGAHSPDERVSITSVQKYWKLVVAVLKEIPKK
ncbi:aminoacyl-histidine dipeptidase [Aquimarina agarivorans]|uniref:aminoacyl-histidine dipeptidase n=1 Tax=Aquimarina agarivorans TaxID=980584 RepID=UPI000248F60B|nr:aminoacyl-histidine dipeptidase [Aquimarina agarivorans]